MKKVLALILAFVMVLGLAACGGKASEPSQPESNNTIVRAVIQIRIMCKTSSCSIGLSGEFCKKRGKIFTSSLFFV